MMIKKVMYINLHSFINLFFLFQLFVIPFSYFLDLKVFILNIKNVSPVNQCRHWLKITNTDKCKNKYNLYLKLTHKIILFMYKIVKMKESI